MVSWVPEIVSDVTEDLGEPDSGNGATEERHGDMNDLSCDGI